VCVVRVAVRFLVVAVLLVVFLGATFTVVRLAGLEARLLVVLTALLLAVVVAEVLLAVVFADVLPGVLFVDVLLTAREAGPLPDFATLGADVFVNADATLSGFVFLDGAVARICLTALVCSSSVIRNS
jgi:hypothetical protein